VLRRLSLTKKLALAVAVPLMLFVLSSVITQRFVNQVKVTGPEYAKVVDAKDLVADILPPPNYIVEAHLSAAQMLRADEATFTEKKELVTQLKKDYETRIAVWKSKNLTPQIKKTFLNESTEPAQQYYVALFENFIPALESAYQSGYTPGGETSFVVDSNYEAASEIFATQLEPLYVKHRAAIVETVKLSVAEQAKTEKNAASTVTSGTRLVLLITVLGALAAAFVGASIARAIRRPVLKLTEAANRAATEDLPRLVAQAQSTTDGELDQVPTVDVDSADELGELAKAFSSMQSTAVDLATQQARVRRNVSENLVNLARRNQALLGRSLALLTKLEQDERDADKLEELFRVDHLTTRMRRNAESLLVLAGAETTRTWSEPVEIGDVVRAAVSAIEAYDRVEIAGLEAVKIKGTSVSDTAHLLAEIVENATAFSAPTTTVAVIGKYRPDGYLIVITDDGIGMSPEELHSANSRIHEIAAFDSTPSKVLGLNVVGRLAARHGIDVSLAESATAGIAARIVLPISMLEGTGMAFSPDAETEVAPIEAGDLSMAHSSAASAAVWDYQQDAPASGAASEPIHPEPSNVRELRPAGLSRRVRGAQMPDTGPEADDEAVVAPNPEDVMGTLASLQTGVERGRSEPVDDFASEFPSDFTSDYSSEFAESSDSTAPEYFEPALSSVAEHPSAANGSAVWDYSSDLVCY
jgi:signal transduction histidine kinase